MNDVCDNAIVKYGPRGPLHEHPQIRRRVAAIIEAEIEPLVHETEITNGGPMLQLIRGLLRRDRKTRREMGAMRREMDRRLGGPHGPPQDLGEGRPAEGMNTEVAAIGHATNDE